MMGLCAATGLVCSKVEFGQADNFRGNFSAFRAMGAVKVGGWHGGCTAEGAQARDGKRACRSSGRYRASCTPAFALQHGLLPRLAATRTNRSALCWAFWSSTPRCPWWW